MAQVTPIPTASGEPEDERDAAVMRAVMTLLDTLPEARRQTVLQRLSASARPVAFRKSSDMMGIVLDFIKGKKSWTVGQIKDEILQQHTDVNPKDVYNTVNYLAKSGRIRRIGHGKYMIDGNLVISSDQLGENPFPNDDQADN